MKINLQADGMARMMLVAIICQGCQSDLANMDRIIDKVDFQIVFLGTDDKAGTIFDSGTDVRFALRLINHSISDIEWKHDYNCELLDTDEFLRTYKLNDGTGRGQGYLPVGYPYQRPVECEAINLPPAFYTSGETIIIKLPWSTDPANEPLTAGSYFTRATPTLIINGKSRSWDLIANFSVK